MHTQGIIVILWFLHKNEIKKKTMLLFVNSMGYKSEVGVIK